MTALSVPTLTRNQADTRYHKKGDLAYNVKDFGAKGDNATDDQPAIQQALDAVRLAGGGVVEVPPGTYRISMPLHPGQANTYYTGLAIGNNTTLIIRQGATIKLLDGVNPTSVQSQLLSSYHMDTTAHDIIICGGGIVDGNAANQASGDYNGIRLMKVTNVLVEGITVQNWRSNYATGGSERFGFDAWWSSDVKFVDCVARLTDAGPAGTGFSATNATKVSFTRCRATGCGGMGFTYFYSSNGQFTDCIAESGTYLHGFNIENSWDVVLTNCLSGTTQPNPPNAGGLPYVRSEVRGNAGNGYMVLCQLGGGRIRFINCLAANNGSGVFAGWQLHSARLDGVAAAGTTGTTIITAADSFTQQMVGRYLSVGALSSTRKLVRIVAVTSTTQVEVSVAHGGASGDGVRVYGCGVELVGCTARDNYQGVSFYPGGNTTQRNIEAFGTKISQCAFIENSSAVWHGPGAAGGSIVSQNGYVGDSANPAVPSSGIQVTNPFPSNMLVYVTGGTITSIVVVGAYSNVADQTGATSRRVMVPAGGRININYSAAPTWKWFINQ